MPSPLEALLPLDRLESLALISLKSAIVYLFLIAGLRITGKRSLGQMNIYDLILIIVLANSVQNAMVGDDNTVAGGMISAFTLIVLNRLFTRILARSTRLEQAMVGTPVLLVHNGHFMRDAMVREHVTQEQILEALREHGMNRITEVKTCILEVDGTLSMIPSDVRTHRTRRHFKALRVQ
ncbi:MAG TPA: YetF domain-containing protein [Candidatus Xenobia bacterium]|jgi:uncharacterized membrane protein YcaP (DUF421 family)